MFSIEESLGGNIDTIINEHPASVYKYMLKIRRGFVTIIKLV